MNYESTLLGHSLDSKGEVAWGRLLARTPNWFYGTIHFEGAGGNLRNSAKRRGRSHIRALVFLTQGLTSLLPNYSIRVRFSTVLCTLSRGRGFSSVESNGVNRSTFMHFFVLVYNFWTVYAKAHYPYLAARSKR